MPSFACAGAVSLSRNAVAAVVTAWVNASVSNPCAPSWNAGRFSTKPDGPATPGPHQIGAVGAACRCSSSMCSMSASSA